MLHMLQSPPAGEKPIHGTAEPSLGADAVRNEQTEKKMQCTRTMEYHSVAQKKEIVPFAANEL